MQDTIAQTPAQEFPAVPVAGAAVESGETASPALEAAATSSPKAVRPVPLHPVRVKARHEVPRLLSYPYIQGPAVKQGSEAVDTVPADTAVADSTGAIEGEELQGIVLIDPVSAYRDPSAGEAASGAWGGGMSWIYLGLAVLFCIVGLKFKGSKRYLKALVTDLTDTRVRHNAFDETVKETSLLVLLNVLWVACAGILLWVCVLLTVHQTWADSTRIMPQPARGIALCMVTAALYLALMMLAYWVVGSVFSDRKLTRLWLKGAAASTGLQTFLLFPLALVALNYPRWDFPALMIAAGVFIIGKIVFLYKGFRIFFTQISSWLLFLYYLCSLEIVPLILTYLGAVTVCTTAF